MKIKITTLIISLVLLGNHFTNAQCPEPYISYGFSEYFCGNSLDLRPIIVMPLQGTFSSSTLPINSITGEIIIDHVVESSHTITYSIPGFNTCPGVSTSIGISLHPLPTILGFSYINPSTNDTNIFCKLQEPSKIIPVPDQLATGIFSASFGLIINATTGAIDVSNTPAGTYNVQFKIEASYGCPSIIYTTTVLINRMPAPAIFDYGDLTFCQSGTSYPPSGTYHNGYFVSDNLDINTITGEINFVKSPAGFHAIRYIIPQIGCFPVSSADTISIDASTSGCNDGSNYVKQDYHNYQATLPIVLILNLQLSTSYCIEIANDSVFSDKAYSICGISTATFQVPSGILSITIGKKYYWHIATVSGNVQSNWSATSSFIIEGTTGISQNTETKGFEVYPNPSKSSFTIENYQQAVPYKIVNVIGEVMNSGMLYYGTNELQADLLPGMYYLQVNRKVIKIITE